MKLLFWRPIVSMQFLYNHHDLCIIGTKPTAKAKYPQLEESDDSDNDSHSTKKQKLAASEETAQEEEEDTENESIVLYLSNN